ncbi:MAG: GNAT family N-acetyltransferase [Eubacteriales bacterium]
MMKFRCARPQDAEALTRLYAEGSALLRARGVNQWQHGEPGAQNAAADIASGVCRIAMEGSAAAAAFSLIPGPDASYGEIDGAWCAPQAEYAVLHRVAAAHPHTGAGGEILRAAIAEARGRGFDSLRADTHPDNLPMQRLLERHGFVRCGSIRLAGGADAGALRIAYERTLETRLYDITQELLSCVVFPGDIAPSREQVMSIASGDAVNVSNLRMCAHNGTHMDAPLHFLDGAAGIAEMPLSQFIGEADVVSCEGTFGEKEAERLIPPGCRRLLLRGGAIPDLSGAQAIVRAGIVLVGVEPQSIGDPAAPAAVHLCLLSAGIAALEGIRLAEVPDGQYLLSAAPLKCARLDGAPVRAVLIS